MDIVERMFMLIDERYKEQKDFATDIDTHPTRVSEWRKRKSTSYQRRLPQIAEVLGTTVQWLVTGEELSTESDKAATPKGSGLSGEFLRIFESLTPEHKNEIIAEMLRRQREK